jgi:hypothetical protein
MSTRKFKTHFRLSDSELDAIETEIHELAMASISDDVTTSTQAFGKCREIIHNARMKAAQKRSQRHFKPASI